MSIAIHDNITRNLYTAAAAQTVFTVNFPFVDETYLEVYQRGAADEPNNTTQLLTLGVDYTTSGAGNEAGGTITLTVGATAGDIVAIIGTEPVDRLTTFQDLNPLTVSLNQQLNELTIMVKQNQTIMDNLTPRYRYDELVSFEVRELNLELPILNDGYIWIGRGNFGDTPDDIQSVAIGDYDALGLLSADFLVGTAVVALPNAQVLGGQGTGLVYSTDDGTTGTVTTLTVGDGLEVDGNQINVTDSVNSLIEIPVTQPEHGLAVGDPVRIDTDGLFVLAQGDTPDNAEGIGIVSRLDATNPTDIFYFQMIGQIDLTGATKDYLPMTTGANYFLDADNEGELVTEPPIIAGQVKKAMIQARSPYTGLVLHYVGQIIGSLPGYADGGGGDEPGGDFDDVVGQECTTPTTLALAQGVWTDIPCLTQTITTGDSASGVQVHANITGDRTGSVANTSLYIRIVRGSTVVGNGVAPGSQVECCAQLFQDNTIQPILFVDYPGSAAAHTYKFQAFALSGAHTMYLQSDFINIMAGMSQLVLTEITPA